MNEKVKHSEQETAKTVLDKNGYGHTYLGPLDKVHFHQ
jgi:hypothetical protein